MASHTPVKFLVTGATSGLGGSILDTLYKTVSDPSSIAAASSRASAAEKLQSQYPGIQFRKVDYDDVDGTLVNALTGVERFFFVSSPEFDTAKRERQHSNVINSAKAAGVGHIYYSSLAFGGYSMDSKASVQQAHLVTEELLKSAGVQYTSVREGIYTNAFPVFVFWYPDTTTVYLGPDGPIAFASREELGEATANLMLWDLPKLKRFEETNNVALLTGSRTYSLADVVGAISKGSGRKVEIQRIPDPTENARVLAAEDAKEGRGKKSEKFFEGWLSLADAMGKGEAAMVDPLMEELLGRKPRDAMEHVTQLVHEAKDKGGYTWHQNYA